MHTPSHHDDGRIGSADAARLIGVSRTTLRRLVKSHELEPVLTAPGGPHGSHVFKLDDVEHYRAERQGAES
jgi:hypothetical protein